MNRADVMVFGAHPDDIELGCGGAVIKWTDAGRAVVVVDLTRGELGTRGSAEIRRREAAQAARILGAAARENLGLQDGHIRASEEAKTGVVEVIRRWRPDLVLLPYWKDRHPDHAWASHLVYEGAFLAGLPRFATAHPSYRPSRLIYYMGWDEFEPTFFVDISEQYERKMESIYAFGTQFRPEVSEDPPTRLTSPSTDWLIRSRMAYHGSLIGTRYAEGFLIRGRLEVDDPLKLRFASH